MKKNHIIFPKGSNLKLELVRILLISIILTIFCLNLHAQQRIAKKLVINGSIKNISDSISYVYANFLDNGSDSAKVVNGRYRFIVETNYAILITLACKSFNTDEAYLSKNLVVFLSEPVTMNITSVDSFSNFSISNSKSFLEYSKLENLAKPYRKKMSALSMKLRVKKDSDNLEGRVETQKAIDSIRYQMGQAYLNFAKKNPYSYTTPFALSTFSLFMKEKDITQVADLYNNLREDERSSYFGKNIMKKLKNFDTKTGVQAPIFEMKDTSGNLVSLLSFKEKYVLLDFWASWCGPCRAENPLLVKLFNKYKDKGFEILSVSLDKKSDREKWLAAIRKDNMTWTNVSDLQSWNNSAAGLYKVSSIPKNFLIDPSGTIIAIDIHEAVLEDTINKIFH